MFNIQTVSFILIVRMSLKIIFHAKAAKAKRLFYDLTINLQSCNILMTFLGIFWILFLELWLHKHNTMTRLLQQQVSMYAAAYLKNLRGPFHKWQDVIFQKFWIFRKLFWNLIQNTLSSHWLSNKPDSGDICCRNRYEMKDLLRIPPKSVVILF